VAEYHRGTGVEKEKRLPEISEFRLRISDFFRPSDFGLGILARCRAPRFRGFHPGRPSTNLGEINRAEAHIRSLAAR
jgi:hypothetical protein